VKVAKQWKSLDETSKRKKVGPFKTKQNVPKAVCCNFVDFWRQTTNSSPHLKKQFLLALSPSEC